MTAALPRGAWPVMLTPFREDRSVDDDVVDAYVDWMIELGVAGIFAVALSAEMYDLDPCERRALAARVVRRAAGRVPVVVSSPVAGSPEAQADGVAEAAASGARAVVLVSGLVAAPEASDAEWLRAVDVVLDRNPGVDIGFYEAPVPAKRLLTTAQVRTLAATDRVVFLKDTSHSIDTMTARLDAMRGSRFQLFNAAIGSLTLSLRAGASGLSGYVANLYPDLVQWLCEHVDDPRFAAETLALQRLLTVIEHSVNLRYPASAKYLLARSSRLPFSTVSRWKPEYIGAHEGLPLEQLADYVRDLDLPTGALASAR